MNRPAVLQCETEKRIPKGSRIITSDDVFDFMPNLRTLNEGIDQKRENLFDEYLEAEYDEMIEKIKACL